MRKVKMAILAVILVGVLTGCAVSQPVQEAEQPPEPMDAEPSRAQQIGETETILGEEYVLTFLDEFDGEKLNRKNWETCPEWERADRGGRWDPDCTAVEDGKLVLSVIYDEKAGCYKSGAIRSDQRFEQAYGYFEASMRVQDTTGFWSAFWMMCGDVQSVDGSGRDGAEVDIMEAYNYSTGSINHALHWDGYGEAHQTVAVNEARPDLYDGEFHTYALRWAPDLYQWYVDGELMWESDAGGVCAEPGYLKLTLEVGSWAGEIVREDLPATVEVDYVRAYQFAELTE